MLFFLFSLVVGWQAWNLYHPNFTQPRWSATSFLAGWLTGELALHVIFWQVLITAFFVLTGAVSGFFGAIGFLLCTTAWVTMAYYYYESTYAEAEVTLALHDGLGAGFESEIDASMRAQFPDEPDRNLMRHPFKLRDPEVETIKDIPYGD